eukprot:6209648-Pleurochrysis_carterae.AAC.1
MSFSEACVGIHAKNAGNMLSDILGLRMQVRDILLQPKPRKTRAAKEYNGAGKSCAAVCSVLARALRLSAQDIREHGKLLPCCTPIAASSYERTRCTDQQQVVTQWLRAATC